MNTVLLPNDFKSFSDSELEIAINSIRTEKDRRQKKFMSQFYEGMPIAITTESGNTYPAYIFKTNKASIEYRYTVDNEYNETWQKTRKVTEQDLKRWIAFGYINPAMSVSFEGNDFYDFNLYTN
jgi:3-deoxy-D-arabino-heptulosonate 7-phosphate (DAHP) synthase